MGRMEMGMAPRMEQRLRMAPQIIQSIEILQLPLMALQERIQQEQMENPVLEMEELQPEPADLPLTKAEDAEVNDDFRRVEAVEDDFHDYFRQTSSRTYGGGDDRDEKIEALQNTPGRRPSLREHLSDQVRFMDLSDRRREVCMALINNLDRDGRLPFALDEVAESLDHPATPTDVEAALKVVQSLDPAGVGARDLAECLLLQIDPDDPDYDLQRQIILHHLPDIEGNRIPKIAKDLGRDIEDVKSAVGAICLLHPAPGRLHDNEVVPLVSPDAFVELVEDHYEVRLEDSFLPRLRISEEYRDMLGDRSGNADTRQFLQKKMDSARWLIDSIAQRRRTILKVSSEIVRAQQAFLDHGLSHLRPLKMQEVADTVGIHVATVSRAIRHKYIQTPRGLFPMKFFFTGGTKSSEGEVQTWDAVKQRITEMVAAEDKANPLSDDDIVVKLSEGGITLARRTVTKYRKALRIPASRQRRSY